MTNARAVSNTTQACVTNVKNVPCFLTCVKLATYSYSFYWNWRYYQIRSAAKWSFTSPRHIITADNGTVPSDDIKDCCVVVILCKFDFGLGGGGQTIVLPPLIRLGGAMARLAPPGSALDSKLQKSRALKQWSWKVGYANLSLETKRTPKARDIVKNRRFTSNIIPLCKRRNPANASDSRLPRTNKIIWWRPSSRPHT